MRTLFFISLAFSTLLSPLYAAEPCRRPSLLSVLRALEERPILVETIPDFDQGPDTTVLYIDSPSGDRMATFVYSVRQSEHGGKLLIIDSITVAEEYRNRGHSRRLFNEALRREQNVTEIESSLMKDNLAAATGETPIDRRRRYSTEECIQMVLLTPAYKIRSAAGFTRITECSVVFASIVLRVMR